MQLGMIGLGRMADVRTLFITCRILRIYTGIEVSTRFLKRVPYSRSYDRLVYIALNGAPYQQNDSSKLYSYHYPILSINKGL